MPLVLLENDNAEFKVSFLEGDIKSGVLHAVDMNNDGRKDLVTAGSVLINNSEVGENE